MSDCPAPWLDNGFPQTERGLVTCTVCESENVHLGQVIVDQLGSETVVGPTGTVLRVHDCDRRGSVVRVLFNCESGHSFVAQFEFYKGSSYVGHEHLTDFDLVGDWPTDLARN